MVGNALCSSATSQMPDVAAVYTVNPSQTSVSLRAGAASTLKLGQIARALSGTTGGGAATTRSLGSRSAAPTSKPSCSQLAVKRALRDFCVDFIQPLHAILIVMGNRQSASTAPPGQPCRTATQHTVCAPVNSSKDVWGPLYWQHLHLRAITWNDNPSIYKTNEEHTYLKTFFENLPCPECRIHARNYYDANLPNLRLGMSYQVWVFSFHNAVNRRLRKPEITFEEYQALYQSELLGRGFR